MTDKFVHLHNHTEYSLLDGAVSIQDLVNNARELDMPAVAITDHGVLYGIIDFYRKAKKAGIKPILGCEVYLTPNSHQKKDSRELYHLVLLVKNKKGYHNLIKLVSKAWLDGFYYKPRIDADLLYEHREGLIGLSACIQGEIPQKILNNQKESAKKLIKKYQSILGKNNFYLELQDHNLRQEKQVNSILLKISNQMKVPTVITNDVHYLYQEDADFHDILLALQTGKTVNDEDRMSFQGEQFYFKNYREMKELFPEVESAYRNTVKIAERCNLDLDFDKFYLPDYPDLEENQSSAQLLRNKCKKGMKAKNLDNNSEAQKRLNYELEIIEEMGYVTYFLIVHDFVVYAEKKKIRVGPGRGSAAGSFVSFLLGITKINPLKYDLIFERFLNPERVTMPDIDIDFDERRDEIIEYVKKRYGREKVAQIGTFGTMAARGAVRDVGRVLEIPYKKADKIAKMIPGSHGITLDKALEENENLTKIYEEDEEVKNLIDYAREVEGMPRHISTHAAGVIIGPRKLTEFVPLQYQDETIITQLPMEELEDLGLLKMDFLGLRNLTIIDKTVELVAKRYDQEIDIEGIPLNDKKVYQMLQQGKTQGVFQMESYLFQDLNQRLKPEEFEDIIALLALGRPGPLSSGLVDDYIKSRHGEKEPEYLHPSLKPILKDTYGMILYQEQVMRIASELADYSLGEADILRRGMGKKKKKLLARERKRFVKGAVNKGIEEETAHEIFDQMEYFAGYGFNKSHSAAYALLAYQTAYLKVNYPSEFMAAVLSTVMNNLDKVSQYIRECKEMGIEILPPDINESDYEFKTNANGEIRFGLKAIKHVGKSAIESIINNRKKRLYQSPADFLERVNLSKVNTKTVEALIKAGALDNFAPARSQLLIKFEDLYNKISSRKDRTEGQTSFFDLFSEEKEFFQYEIDYPDIEELDINDKLQQEKEYLGIYVSGHPLEVYDYKIKKFVNIDCEKAVKIKSEKNFIFAGIVVENKEIITKRDNKMSFLTVEDWSGNLEVVVFPDLYNKINFKLEQGVPLLIKGHYDDSVIADEILLLAVDFLEIKVDKLSQQKLKKLKKVLKDCNSSSPVFLQKNDSYILTDHSYWAENREVFIEKLKKIVDDNLFRFF